jgi:acyl-CoA thioesterase FadM
MYPAVRAVHAILSGMAASEIALFDAHDSYHRAWPWDVDMYLELNHGRTLTLFELGRWRMAGRMRLLSALQKQRIAFAIAGVSVRYRKRIPMMARFRMVTRFAGWDERFLYVDQSMWLGAECANQALVRAALRSRGKTMPPGEFLAGLGLETQSPELPDWISAWIDAEGKRPWPPELAVR